MRAITLPLIDIDLHDTHRLTPSLWYEPVRSDATGGEPDAQEIRAVAPISGAKAGDLTFLVNAEYEKHLATTGATAVIVGKRYDAAAHLTQLVHKNPYYAFAKASQVFFPPKAETPGVSAKAHVEKSAEIAKSATVYPFAYVGAGVKIGERAVVYPGCYLGENVQIGDDSVLRANVVVEPGIRIGRRVLIHGGTVLGADGFGFAPGEKDLAKIPQIGAVEIQDDVEIGGLCTVDRGALENTVVGEGTKLDSHVHIGHGASLGKWCMICGQAGLAGSARLGNRVVVGGGSAISNRVVIADNVQVGACSGVTKSIPDAGTTHVGFPAGPQKEWQRSIVYVRRLPELEKKLKDLEAKLARLEANA